MASRYGSAKQVEPLGPSNEVLLDYAVYDAIRAGFGKVVFIIRHDSKAVFEERVSRKIRARHPEVAIEYAFQAPRSFLPEKFVMPAGRTKPWGTAHAVLCASGVVREPFCVINADDFYGRASYQTIAGHLAGVRPDSLEFAMVGYQLEKTLSPNGSVTRGICKFDAGGFLSEIDEVKKLVRYGDDGKIYDSTEVKSPDGGSVYVKKGVAFGDTLPVSMNIWGLTPAIFPHLRRIFREFLGKSGQMAGSECYLPESIGRLISEKHATCKLFQTDGDWFGVTYKADAPVTRERLASLVKSGVYPMNLWA
jgi:hypothetical protein